MNKILIYYGLSITTTFLGLLITYSNSITQQAGGTEDWVLIFERLGIPTIFLIGLLYLISKAGKAVYPFFQKQVEDLISIPKEQIKLEREERIKQEDKFEKLLLKISEDNNKTIMDITTKNNKVSIELSNAIRELAKRFE